MQATCLLKLNNSLQNSYEKSHYRILQVFKYKLITMLNLNTRLFKRNPNLAQANQRMLSLQKISLIYKEFINTLSK